MSSQLTLVLCLVALQLVISVPTVVGDCSDDAVDYSNCGTCYLTFAKALVNTNDNKYRLSRTFFPVYAVSPVEVEVTYMSTNGTHPHSKLWYWVVEAVFMMQPLELLLYRSLLFSPPSWRKQSLTLLLPDECLTNDEFLEHATQRVRI